MGAQGQNSCRGLVLAGGGARGSYQIGVWRALDELGWRAGVVTGTSVGCLNGALYVLGQYEMARDMWLSIRSSDVMALPAPGSGLGALGEAVRQFMAEGGLDVSPLEQIVSRVLDEQELRASSIRFGLVTVEKKGLKPRELSLEEIPQGKLRDYLLASSACFPALRPRTIDGVEYLDGGYADNMPAGLAARLGAEELVCVDLEGLGITKPNRTGLPTTLIRSHWELGDILRFDPAVARRNMAIGYFDTMRAFGRLRGDAYPIALEGSAQAAAEFRGRLDPLEEWIKVRWPAAHLPATQSQAREQIQDQPQAPQGVDGGVKVRPLHVEHPADQGEAVGVDAGGGQGQHRVAGGGLVLVDDLLPVHDAHGEARQVVVVGVHHAGVLGGLTADEGAARLDAALGHAAHNVRDPLGDVFAAGDVV